MTPEMPTLTLENIDQLEALIAEVRPEPWEWTTFTKPDGSPIINPDDVAETTAETARKSGGSVLHGITFTGAGDDDGPNVICYTGNGPQSAVHARAITWLWMVAPELLRIARQHLKG